jgi:hypothetical protein
LKDKACEGLGNEGHEESEEGGDGRVSDTEEKRLREEAVYEKIMVSLQNGISAHHSILRSSAKIHQC